MSHYQHLNGAPLDTGNKRKKIGKKYTIRSCSQTGTGVIVALGLEGGKKTERGKNSKNATTQGQTSNFPALPSGLLFGRPL